MQPKKHYFAHIPTIAIFIVFAMSAPLGVLLFILKSIDKNAEKEETAAAQAQADYRSDPASPQSTSRQEQDPEAACGTDRPTAEQKSAQNWHKTIAVICTILGAVFLFTGAEELIDCLFDFPDFDDLLPALATTIGGAGALWTGLRMDRTRKLERQQDKIAVVRVGRLGKLGQKLALLLPPRSSLFGAEGGKRRVQMQIGGMQKFNHGASPFLPPCSGLSSRRW